MTLHLKNGKNLFDSSIGKWNCLSGFRRPLDASDFSLAAIVLGKMSSVLPVGISTIQASPTDMKTMNTLLHSQTAQGSSSGNLEAVRGMLGR